MKVSSIQRVFGWYNNKRVVTEYNTSVNNNGSITVNSQRWLYTVHIYDNKARMLELHSVGKNIDMKV